MDCSKVYVGHTTQLLKCRLSGHRSDRLKLTKLRDTVYHDASDNNIVELERFAGKSAVIKHAMEHDHDFDFDAARVLTMSESSVKLKFLEMLYIQHLNTVNLRTDVEGINIVYSGLLDKIKNT